MSGLQLVFVHHMWLFTPTYKPASELNLAAVCRPPSLPNPSKAQALDWRLVCTSSTTLWFAEPLDALVTGGESGGLVVDSRPALRLRTSVLQLFKHNCQKLPPWRQTSTYMRLYTTCVDCDAVPSYVLLRTINQQLAKFSKDAACVFKGPGGLDDHHLDCLLNILGTVDNLDASLLHLSEPSGHWADSYFEKEPPCVPTPAPTQSALSSLLEEIGST